MKAEVVAANFFLVALITLAIGFRTIACPRRPLGRPAVLPWGRGAAVTKRGKAKHEAHPRPAADLVDLLRRVAGEGRVADEHLVGHDSERPPVRVLGVPTAAALRDNLRRQVIPAVPWAVALGGTCWPGRVARVPLHAAGRQKAGH
jgi:hypothetical protein